MPLGCAWAPHVVDIQQLVCAQSVRLGAGDCQASACRALRRVG